MGARKLQKGNTWRLRRDDAPAEWGGYNQKTPQQSGAATTSASVIGKPRVVATSLLLRQGYGGHVC